jgi:hypothetical protein
MIVFTHECGEGERNATKVVVQALIVHCIEIYQLRTIDITRIPIFRQDEINAWFLPV